MFINVPSQQPDGLLYKHHTNSTSYKQHIMQTAHHANSTSCKQHIMQTTHHANINNTRQYSGYL